MKGLDNIQRVLDLADNVDLTEGKLAYGRYNALMARLAEYYNLSHEQMTALFVATSPNNDYLNNLRSAVSIAAGFRDGKGLDQITVSTYKACAVRAWSCLHGKHFLDFTKGKKTRAFYRNILDPSDPEPVTIDGHMIAIYHGRYLTMKQAVRELGHYETISEAVREAAVERGLVANQVQSILWFTWKRIHKPVAGDGQLSLWSSSDHWQLCLDHTEIKPFQHKEISEHRRRELAKQTGQMDSPALFEYRKQI